jgi:hypothetical protein
MSCCLTISNKDITNPEYEYWSETQYDYLGFVVLKLIEMALITTKTITNHQKH